MIGIICFNDLHLMQFLYKYTSILDKHKVSYEVLYWNRSLLAEKKDFDGETVSFEYKMNTFQPFHKKIFGFLKYANFIRKQIRTKKYDKLIVLTTQSAIPVCDILLGKYRERYVYDYRDVTKEHKFGFYKKTVKKLCHNSYFTAISSLGFKEVLGESEKFVMSHNERNFKKAFAEHTDSDKIRIVFWGMVRQVEFNKKVCDVFGNNPGFELIYHGEGFADELKRYCEEKKYNSVKFTGRYSQDKIPGFAQNTDVLLNLYENDSVQKLAMTVKLYDGITYGLPMIISKDSFMGNIMSDNDYVYPMDIENVNIEEFTKWYKSLDRTKYPYDKQFEKIKSDDEFFEKKLLYFAEK